MGVGEEGVFQVGAAAVAVVVVCAERGEEIIAAIALSATLDNFIVAGVANNVY